MKTIQLCIYVITVSLLFACQPNATEEHKPGNQQPLGIAEQGKDPRQKETKTAEEIAEHLVHLTERVPNVNSATAIVLGDLAVIGIDVKAGLDRSDVGIVKYEAAEALSNDPHGAYAFISADPDINARLKEMRKEINAGHPIAGIMDELAGIIGRIIPVVPGAEHRKSEPEPTDANQGRLSEDQNRNLKEIQEEQGKRNMDDEKLSGHPNDDGTEREKRKQLREENSN
ncbi:MAG: YhcN/YlaJ family sporulation lipoprotein [Anaerobacillus sp.]|uniref:YhcN/YlaJ family sporulation lipoprotein n=1 Tax=Anaerobacillus sp. TaxID=1872506 RepID=UPI00391C6F0B